MVTEKENFDFPINNDLSKFVVPIKKNKSVLTPVKQEKRLSEKKLTLLRKQQRSLKHTAS